MQPKPSLKNTFPTLIKKYSNNELLQLQLWNEIQESYSNPARHYHNLQHLQALFTQLLEVKTLIQDRDTILFSLFYHDIVYNPALQNNEQLSAEIAQERMFQIGLPNKMVTNCYEQIMATKTHVLSSNTDTNFFTDADLSILGPSREIYSTYFYAIRQEYSIYPDEAYNDGRQKVMKHFLAMDRIFKTDYFYTKLEINAKRNLMQELIVITKQQSN
jgi:predicted metal-dependent HD superfamily phosphohydrolase